MTAELSPSLAAAVKHARFAEEEDALTSPHCLHCAKLSPASTAPPVYLAHEDHAHLSQAVTHAELTFYRESTPTPTPPVKLSGEEAEEYDRTAPVFAAGSWGVCGMRRRVFWSILAIAAFLLVVILAVGLGVGLMHGSSTTKTAATNGTDAPATIRFVLSFLFLLPFGPQADLAVTVGPLPTPRARPSRPPDNLLRRTPRPR